MIQANLYRGKVRVSARRLATAVASIDVGVDRSGLVRRRQIFVSTVRPWKRHSPIVQAHQRWRQCETYLSTQCPQAGPTARFPPPHVHAFGSNDHPQPSAAWPGPVVSLIERVTDRGSFVALRSHSTRVRRGVLRIGWIPDDAGRIRVAYALSRRVGNAVVRNRIRRRLRSVFETLERARVDDPSIAFPSGTYLVSATRQAADVPFAELVETARSLLSELDRRGASR